MKTDEVDDLQEWLGELVRQVDSSLLDEWERLTNPELAAQAEGADDTVRLEPERRDVTTNERAFGVMVRNELFRWVQMFARQYYGELAGLPGADGHRWTPDEIKEDAAAYWDEYTLVGIDTDARHTSMLLIDRSDPDAWRVQQIIADPDDHHEWRLHGVVDLPASAAAGEAVVLFDGVERLAP